MTRARGVAAVVVALVVVGCRRTIREEIIVPSGEAGWFEIIEDEPACTDVREKDDLLVVRVDAGRHGCIGSHLPDVWFFRTYRYSGGDIISKERIHGETGTSVATYGDWERHAFYFCIGSNEECDRTPLPPDPPGLGWRKKQQMHPMTRGCAFTRGK